MSSIDVGLLELASPEERTAYEQALVLETALLSPFNYTLYVTPQTEDFAHQRALDRYMVALIEHRLYHSSGIGPQGVFDKATGQWHHPETGEETAQWLLVSMPPRHGKSFLVSEHAPAWFVTKYPDKDVILTSYEADFAASWGRKARDHVDAHPEFDVRVSVDGRAASDWHLKGHRGGMRTAGAGGPITGKGAHLMIVDDAIKNHEDAMSQVQRNKLGQWFTSTVRTRLEPGGVGVLMATRWHEDDLIGRVSSKPGRWYYLNLPALAFSESEADQFEQPFPDPLGREPTDALCPERYTSRELQFIREHGDPDDESGLSGEYWFNAMYQGVPEIEGGGIIPRPFQYFTTESVTGGSTFVLERRDGTVERIARSKCVVFATMDLAASVKTSADWTVWALWAVTPSRDLLLLNVHRVRMESPDHTDQTRRWYREPESHGIRYVGIENKTFGLSLFQALVREPGISTRPLFPDGDKIARAIPAGNGLRNGRVFFPRGALFLQTWEDELVKFPNTRHDDQVDVFSMAWKQVEDMPLLNRQKEAEPVTMQEKVDAYQAKKAREHDKKKRGGRGGRGLWHPALGRR